MEVELAHGGRGQSSSDRRGGYGGGGGGGGSARFGVSRHSEFRVIVRGLPSSASRQDLKNHMRKAGDVCFAEVTQGCDGTYGVVGYTNYDDMKYAIRKFDDTEFRNHRARAFIRVKKYESSQSRSPSRNRSRSRSRSLGRSKSKRIGVSYEMEMEIDDNFVIFDCKPGSNNLIFGGALIFSKTLDSIMTVGNYNLERNYKAIHSMLNNRMWMVHDRVNCTRLTYGCEKIGKPPPIPKSIIDTSLFTSSKTKLGRAAAMFGLGVQKHGSNWAYKGNLSAILTCKEIMSKLDVPVKTLNDTVHPMLYYLMQYNDQMKDEVRARYFNEAEYPSLNKIDDLPIMKLVDDVLKNREAELKKLYYELEKQKEDERIPLVYYKYEEIEGLYTYQGDKKDDDDDVEDEDSDDCDEFARTRGGGGGG